MYNYNSSNKLDTDIYNTKTPCSIDVGCSATHNTLDLFSIPSILFILLLSFIPFQDSFLSQTFLGQFGTNLSIFVVNLYFLFIIIFHTKLNINIKQNITVLALITYSIILLFISGPEIKNTNLFIKVIINTVFYSQPLIVFYVFNFFYSRYPYLLKITAYFSLTITMMFFVYLIVEHLGVFSLDDNKLLHGVPNSMMRPRLFSQESSMAATVFITFGMLALIQYKNIFTRVALVAFMLIGLYLLQSKGTIVVAIVIYMTSLLKFKFRHAMFFLILAVLLCFILRTTLLEYLLSTQSGFEEYTSLSTRMTMLIAGIISLFRYPLGAGFGAYLDLFDSNIVIAKSYVGVIFLKVGLFPNFTELDTYFVSAKNYSTKSMLFNSIMYFGIVGAYVFYTLHRYVYKKIGGLPTLQVLFFYLLLMHTLFIDSLNQYHFWMAFAFMYNYWRHE